MPNKWEIVLLSYPFTNLQGSKVRPAVVISPNDFNRQSQDALFMLITSNVSRSSQYEVHIPVSHPEYPATGLAKDSMVRVGKLVMLEKSLVRVQIGRIGPILQAEIEVVLRSFFQLTPFQPSLPPTAPI